MIVRLKGLLAGAIVGIALIVPLAAAFGDSDSDHDLARDLYERGEIRSLSEILRVVGRQMPGDIVSVDLVKLAGKWVYRVQVVRPDGHRTTLDVDAAAAKVDGVDRGSDAE